MNTEDEIIEPWDDLMPDDVTLMGENALEYLAELNKGADNATG